MRQIYYIPPLWLDYFYIMSNLNSSNTDDAFTMANSNSFFQSLRNSTGSSRKQIFRDIFFSSFYHEIVCCIEDRKDIPWLLRFAFWPGAMINPQWLELPMSRMSFHGPKDIRAIKVFQYLINHILYSELVIATCVGHNNLSFKSISTIHFLSCVCLHTSVGQIWRRSSPITSIMRSAIVHNIKK